MRSFEKIQKVGARTLRKCEECGGKLEKLVSRSAFHLKGGGWFDSGYTSGGGKSAAASSGGKPSGSSNNSDTSPKKTTAVKSKSD
jgi:putative FmdB family regulatory protein